MVHDPDHIKLTHIQVIATRGGNTDRTANVKEEVYPEQEPAEESPAAEN